MLDVRGHVSTYGLIVFTVLYFDYLAYDASSEASRIRL